MAGIKEVAKDAGVSVATVSYVLNKNKYVSPDLTKKVEDSIKKLNYNCNHVARSLRNKKTYIIGVVLQNVKNIFFPQLLEGLEEYARSKKYRLLFLNSYNDPYTERDAITTLRNMWVDGIILDSCVAETDKDSFLKFLLDYKSGKKIPVVLLERSLGSENVNVVKVDNFHGAYQATKHLIEKGRKNIMHIAGTKDWSMTEDRIKGYIQALKDGGLEKSILVRYSTYKPQDGYAIMKELLQQNSTIDGVFAANDQMAIGAMKAIMEMGFNIPGDISVVGFDNIFVSTLTEISLTTINVPKYSIGNAAAALLINAIENPDKKPEQITMTSNLIVRQSTDLKGQKNWELFGW